MPKDRRLQSLEQQVQKYLDEENLKKLNLTPAYRKYIESIAQKFLLEIQSASNLDPGEQAKQAVKLSASYNLFTKMNQQVSDFTLFRFHNPEATMQEIADKVRPIYENQQEFIRSLEDGPILKAAKTMGGAFLGMIVGFAFAGPVGALVGLIMGAACVQAGYKEDNAELKGAHGAGGNNPISEIETAGQMERVPNEEDESYEKAPTGLNI
jgi:hypothetical protein